MRQFQNSLQTEKTGFISNPNALLLLAVFNVALLMNFHEMLWKIPSMLIVMAVSTLALAINYKCWWANLGALLMGFYIFGTRFPRQANHSNIEFAVEIVILGIMACKILRPKFRFAPELTSHVFRICLVTIYFYTGFHKLNTDFFNPCVSCVDTINDYAISNLTGTDFTVSRPLSVFFQYATIFTEMILPFGLLFAKTRRFSGLLLLAFHFYLAFTVFADFSALAVFLILGCLLDFGARHLKAQIIRGLRIYLLCAIASVAVMPLLPKAGISGYHWSFLHGLVYNIGLLFFLVPVLRGDMTSAQSIKKRHIPVLAFCIILISIWSMKSYIGLGNAGNLTMFSNLLTEKSRSNHLLIDTKKTKIFDFEEDAVLILELPPKLKNQKLEHYKLPVIEFRYQVSRWISKYRDTKINCTLVYRSDTIAIPDLRHSGFAKAKWWYRYVNFRKIQPEGPGECYW